MKSTDLELREIAKRNRDYKRVNEILYLFSSASDLGWKDISKIGVQKTIYLSEVLAPYKKLALSFLNFIYHYRGPYSKDIQNSLDYLVSCGALEITALMKHNNIAFVNYRINGSGEKIVKALLKYAEEREKYEWIKLILRVVDAYKEAFGIGRKYQNVDKIIDLVYEEPSFRLTKSKGKGEFINMVSEDNASIRFLEFLKNIEEIDLPKILIKKPANDLETILLMFFEYLYLDFLKKQNV